MSKEALQLAQAYNIELKTCGFKSKTEQTRSSRLTRVGVFQHATPLPTSSPILEMREAVFQLAKNAIAIAAAANVNVFCFQEAWSKY